MPAQPIISASLIGEKELLKELERLPLKVRRQGMRSAVSAGATPVLRAAKRKVKVVTGVLKRSLGRRATTDRRTGEPVVIVGPRTRYSETVDGVQKIPNMYAGKVEREQPFMRPAFDTAHQEATEAAGRRLWAFISKRKGAPPS